MTITDGEGHIYSTNHASLMSFLIAILLFLLVLEIFSSFDSTLFHFNDNPDQHVKLFFNREDINQFIMNDGAILTNVDRDMLGITYLATYYHFV